MLPLCAALLLATAGIADARKTATVGVRPGIERIQPSPRKPKDIPPATAVETRELVVRRGDTLYGMLHKAGIDNDQRTAALRAVRDLFDPSRLRPGDRIVLSLSRQDGKTVLNSLHLEMSASEDLTVELSPATPLTAESGPVQIRQVGGIAGPDFRQTLLRARLPASLIDETLKAFQYDPDFPSPPPPDGRFRMVYETTPTKTELRYMAFREGDRTHHAYRCELDPDTVAFVGSNGAGIAFVNFASPVKNPRVTSPFGWRVHPVLGDRRFHNGVDFGAPRGTRVYASADGVVTEVGWHGNYGKRIRIRHNADVETVYAHLNGFAKTLRRGMRVKQGQVIGYVGKTGLATGPHLYYEMVVAGEFVDPLAPPAVFPVRLSEHQLNTLKTALHTPL